MGSRSGSAQRSVRSALWRRILRAVLLGATRGIGRALARQMADRGERIFLLGRNPDALERSARDLETRSQSGPIGQAHCDLLDRDGFGAALDAAASQLGGIDTVVVSAGEFAPQEVLEREPDRRDRVLSENFTHTVHFCEEARVRLLGSGGGTLCVLSSVAGDRPRKPVILYGAAKAGLSHYMNGLDHRYRAQGLRAVLVKPGFVATSMTTGLDPPPLVATPSRVARDILRSIDRGTPEIYTPAIWRAIMFGIKHTPRWVMRRISF